MPEATQGAAQAPSACEFVIQGITKDGRLFRPSDGAARLCGAVAAYRFRVDFAKDNELPKLAELQRAGDAG